MPQSDNISIAPALYADDGVKHGNDCQHSDSRPDHDLREITRDKVDDDLVTAKDQDRQDQDLVDYDPSRSSVIRTRDQEVVDKQRQSQEKTDAQLPG